MTSLHMNFIKSRHEKGQDDNANDEPDCNRSNQRGSICADGGATNQKHRGSVPMYIVVNDEEACEPNRENFLPKTRKVLKDGWRDSVSGESYNPEKDDVFDNTLEVHTKTPEQRQRLMEAVKDILLFRSLDDVLMSRVIDAMFERQVEPGDYVICQGDDGDNFYVVEKGIFHVIKQCGVGNEVIEERVLTHDNHGSFGELALMYNQPRAASVRAVTSGVLWAMDRQSFRRIVLHSAYRKRQMYEGLLRKVSFLEALDDYERATVADALRSITYADGDLIIREDDHPPAGLYIIERGAAKVTMRVQQAPTPSNTPTSLDCCAKPDRCAPLAEPAAVENVTASEATTEKVVAWLGVGDYFGEKALIEDGKRPASVYAVATDSRLLDEDDDDDGKNGGASAAAAATSRTRPSDEFAGKVVVAFLETKSFERLLGPCRDLMVRSMSSYTRSTSCYEFFYTDEMKPVEKKPTAMTR